MERIGIYGGTFNPPHLGHIGAAAYACERLALSELLLIPTCEAPHKEIAADSPTPYQRLEMLQLATAELPEIQVCDIELRRGGVSYTYETVAAVREEYPNDELILFMGTDMFLSFQSWKYPEKILKDASLGVFYRGEAKEESAVAAQKTALEAMGATVYLVKNPVTVISSTDLRRLLLLNCADAYLPSAVTAYIRRNRLYGAGISLKSLPVEELKKAVIKLLKPKRVPHVMGCCETAAELARHWGANEEDATRAGLLHDVTKAFDGPLQMDICKHYGVSLDAFSMHNPKTLHALTGSLVARYVFGESNAVVDAICNHTTGKANMNLLEKIIYVADYMEPNRDFPGVEILRALAYTDIDAALERGLEMTLAMLRQQKREISPQSMEALQYLQENRKSGSQKG